MKILNFGSLNIDYVYEVDHIVEPGETISSTNLQVFPGGKGLNQSISLAKAGMQVYHAGLLGQDGDLLNQALLDNGVDTRFVKKISKRSGNAIIQVDKEGQNSIVLYSGANREITYDFVDNVLDNFDRNDWILLQNEISLNNYIIESAFKKDMNIVLNPSPYDKNLETCDLSKVDLFLLNEVEGEQITGIKEPHKMLELMNEKYPNARVVLTLGENGSLCQDRGVIYKQSVYPTQIIDTTAAGDTFTGYFISANIQGKSIKESLRRASAASAITISRKGAAVSIPSLDEVLSYENEMQN